MKKSFSFFRVSARLWRRHAAGVLVATLGLVCAFAFTLVAATQLYDGMTSDRWLKGADSIYQLNEQWLMNGQKGIFGVSSGTVVKAGLLLKDNTPEVTTVTRLFPMPDATLKKAGDDTEFTQSGVLQAEANLTSVLDFPMARGDLTTVLGDASAMVLTEQQAERLFGQTDPIGQTVTLTYKEITQDYRVAAIMANIPPNSQFDINFLVPWNETLQQLQEGGMGTGLEANTYFRVAPGTDETLLADHVTGTLSSMLPPSGNIIIELSIDRLVGALYDGKATHYPRMKIPKRMVTTQLVMASVLLLAAGFNFIHVFTSINLGRGREVAVRRISGASRWHLARVFLMEAGFLTLFAFAVSVLVAHDLSVYAAEFGAHAVNILHPNHAPVLGTAMLIALLIGLLAATAMLMQISRMTPQSLLHRSQRAITGSGDRLKRVLVGVQAMALVGSLIAALQVYHQFNHFLTMDRGMRTEGALIIQPPFEEKESARFKNDFLHELEAIPGIQEIGQVGNPPFQNSIMLMSLRGQGQTDLRETVVRDVGTNYFELFEVTPILTSGEPMEGQKNLVAMPWSSLSVFGYATPEDAINSHLIMEYPKDDGELLTVEYRIMAVVPDVKDSPSRHKQPVIYMMTDVDDNWYVTFIAIADQTVPGLKQTVQDLWLKHFPDYQAEENVRWYTDAIAEQYASTRSTAYVLLGMGVFCLLLCFASLYGMANHYAITKAREIALRRVLGAGKREVSKLFLKKMLMPVLIGGLLVLVPTWWLMNEWIATYTEQALLPLPAYGLVLIGILLIAALMLASHVRRILSLRPAGVLYHE